MPAVQPAPEPVSPEPIATRSSRVIARSPEPTFISIPAVTAALSPAMVPMPTMVPAPVPVPSAVSNDVISRPLLPPSEPAPTVPEKTKTNFAVVKSGESVSYRSYFCFVVFSNMKTFSSANYFLLISAATYTVHVPKMMKM